MTFNRDPVTVCFGDSGAPTFDENRVVAIASDGAADCASADVRARVDSKEVRTWIRSQIDLRSGSLSNRLLQHKRRVEPVVAYLKLLGPNRIEE